ncbi:hypothetical protein COU54_04365 [Candidatus Pacearchaeota archaeon CG10_big_fil_rev_8_21_14_0_10_31_24]|nr:MAG: hypothetical protein COU54_04365 [Candidatus Pacearchaeota archaeon CG10_big_fil_rev_8_21_14_0_10_31_24]
MNMKKEINLGGIFIPLVTPFYQGKFDSKSMSKLIDSVNNYVDGFVPCLSSGEGDKLTLEVWIKIINFICNKTSKPVFAGILKKGELEIVKYVKKANSLPCKGIVIPTLYKSDKENLRYIGRISKLTGKEIIVYNTESNPFRSLNSIKKLDGIHNIVALKDSSTKIVNFRSLVKLRKINKLKLCLLQGMENLLLESGGCDGYILSLINTEPKLCSHMFNRQDKFTNNKILDTFYKQNLGGKWYITIKAILFSRGTISSAEEVIQEVKLK